MTLKQRRTLEAAIARIIPCDDEPGALEVGAADYVVAALNSGLYQHWWPLFVKGLELLDALAAEAGGASFSAARADVQDEVLRRLGELTGRVPHLFLSHLVKVTLEGCLGDPRRGGNRDRRGWQAVGASAPDRCRRVVS